MKEIFLGGKKEEKRWKEIRHSTIFFLKMMVIWVILRPEIKRIANSRTILHNSTTKAALHLIFCDVSVWNERLSQPVQQLKGRLGAITVKNRAFTVKSPVENRNVKNTRPEIANEERVFECFASTTAMTRKRETRPAARFPSHIPHKHFE